MTQTLIEITNWQDGMADSPHVGIGLMRNADIESFPGAVKVRPQPTSIFHTALSQTFTADASTDICTITGPVPITGTAVTVSNSGGALPSPLAAATIYFIIKQSSTTFKLATNLDNALTNNAINITDAGTGTHTVTTVNPGTINHMVSDPRLGNKFMQDSNGRIWVLQSGGTQAFLIPGNTLTNAAGNGLALFFPSDNNATYLFAFRNAAIDVTDVFSEASYGNPSWTNAWQSLNSGASSGNSHHAIVGQDNVIYFCDSRYVGSIRENAGTVFAPGTSSTYTYNNQALDMPLQEVNQWLEELGQNLLIAGGSFNKVYPWDRVSDSFNLPLQVPETGIKRLKNIGGVVYILAGTKGIVYSTQGSYVKTAKVLPAYVVNNSGTLQSTVVTWGGIAARNGALLFGVGGLTSGNSGAYLLYPDGRLVLDNMPSTGSAVPTMLFSDSEFYYIGYASGADVIGTTRYASYNTVIHTALYKVADKTTKGKVSQVEVQVAKPASTGHIRTSYRTDTTSSFTTIDTYAADGVTTSFQNSEAGLTDLENIEFQIEMDGDFELVAFRAQA